MKSPATSPLFLLSLLVLVVNDHFLKGSGLLPGVVTGKLSDFAGFVVAPITLAAMLRSAGLRSERVRAFAYLATAVVFSAINLSRSAASVMEQLLHWTITTDPTDLIALAIAPWVFRFEGKLLEQSPKRDSRLIVAFAAMACVATSETSAGLTLDASSEMVQYQVATGPSSTPCVSDSAHLASRLSRSDFAAPEARTTVDGWGDIFSTHLRDSCPVVSFQRTGFARVVLAGKYPRAFLVELDDTASSGIRVDDNNVHVIDYASLRE